MSNLGKGAFRRATGSLVIHVKFELQLFNYEDFHQDYPWNHFVVYQNNAVQNVCN